MFDLSGRTAVIVGGGGKMGMQFGETLSQAGAEVILAEKDAEKCRTIAKQLEDSRRHALPLDAGDAQQVRDLFAGIYGDYRRLDILIYNVMAKPAGYYRDNADYPLPAWEETLRGNLTGAFLCCREAAKYMKKTGAGAIVLTASIYGVVAPDQRIYDGCEAGKNIYSSGESLNCPAVYSASKAGLIGLGKHLAARWGRDNIRVNLLTPGGVFDGQEEAFHQEYVSRTPLGRMAAWSDFNGAALFLVSDASRYMTGANLVVDGGWTAW